MARKIRAKLIMELREQSVSRRSIASSRHMSMDSVSEVFDIAAERSITWDQVKDMPEDESIACSASKGTGAIACSRSPIGTTFTRRWPKSASTCACFTTSTKPSAEADAMSPWGARSSARGTAPTSSPTASPSASSTKPGRLARWAGLGRRLERARSTRRPERRRRYTCS